MKERVIQIQNITKTFTKENTKIHVLKNFSLDVHKGEFVCILGPSGCGKSTLLRQIAALDSCDNGEIILNGKSNIDSKGEAIMVFQDFNQLFPWKKTIDNIRMSVDLKHKQYSKEQRLELAYKYLNLVNLNDKWNSYPAELSGGMKQKIAIGRALAMEPKVLLMDEPFGSLDAITRGEMQRTLLQLWFETKITIVFVTHDIEEAILLSDKLVVMNSTGDITNKVLKNSIQRPRELSNHDFLQMYQKIYGLLN